MVSGKCVKNTVSPGVSNSATWSEWSRASPCTSGCITRSKGFSTKHRTCIKQNPVTVDSTCPGSSTEVTLCNTASCPQYRLNQDFASDMCKKFLTVRKIFAELKYFLLPTQADSRLSGKITKLGYQPSHLNDRVDIACTVHCKKPKGGWSVTTSQFSALSQHKTVC